MASLLDRNGTYYVQWYEGRTKRRRSLRTDSLQVAKERLRQFESAQYRGEGCPLPTRTPIGEVVAAYIEQAKTHKTRNSFAKDLSYLRELFGECCDALKVADGRAAKCKARRCPEDGRRKLWPITASHFEAITTKEIADFIAERVRARGIKPKTANRYREVIAKVFAWAMDTERVRMPMDRNPAARVARYNQPAPEIEYLSLVDIDVQLASLDHDRRLQVMVATLIFSGLRREELLWLQTSDSLTRSDNATNGLLRIVAKTVAGESWQPKTKRNRAVPVSSRLADFLDCWKPPASDHGWLFPSPQGTRWDANNFSHALMRTNRASGLRWNCLHYRHTFGSQLAQRGVSLYQISGMMGNSPEICRRHYAALIPEAMASLVEF